MSKLDSKKNASEEAHDAETAKKKQDPEDALRWELHLLEKQLVLYDPKGLSKVRLENKVLQKDLQKLLEQFQFAFENRFGPRNFMEAKSYFDVLRKTAPIVEEDEEEASKK